MTLTRDALILDHLYIVSGYARAIRRTCWVIPYDDLYQYGVLGLIDAADRFDRDKGVPFEAYARQRAYGSIIDAVRRECSYSRHTHQAPRFFRVDEARDMPLPDMAAAIDARVSLEQIRKQLSPQQKRKPMKVEDAQAVLRRRSRPPVFLWSVHKL